MTKDQAIDIAVRLRTATMALRAALKIAEAADGDTPETDIAAALDHVRYALETCGASSMDKRELMLGPGYWPNETSGVLRPAIETYLTGAAMTPEQIAAVRAYLRQWIMAPAWDAAGPSADITDLRERIDNLVDRETIDDWLQDAEDIGMDPL